jgi:SnoaL-like domain
MSAGDRSSEEVAMSTEASREVVVQYISEALNEHSRARMDELIAADYVRHLPGGQTVNGMEPVGQSAAEQGWAACPDWRYDLEMLIAEVDLVAVRVSAGGNAHAAIGPGSVEGCSGDRREVYHHVDGNLSRAGWPDRGTVAGQPGALVATDH